VGRRLSDVLAFPLLVRRVVRRWPFEIVTLPLALGLAERARGRRSRLAQGFLRKASKAAFRNVHHRLGLAARGRMRLACGDGDRDLVFDGRNSHFLHLVRRPGAAAYETETAALLDALVGDGDVFFDVGANWGCFALFVAVRSGFAGKIHAFEPLARTFADLESLVRQAGFEQTIRCHHVALSDAAGEAPLARPLHGALTGLEAGGARETVTLCRLDDLGLPPPDVIKIDVEGHEPQMLAGAFATLEAQRPMIVFESWYRPRDVEASVMPLLLIEELGYALYRPMWRGIDGVLGDSAPAEGAEGELALLPFAAAHRLAFACDFNALACHPSRRAELEALFGDG
jgi:FkbM family methyltransferase